MISEGAKYTKNKLKYLLTVGIIGVACQIMLILFLKDYHFNILITFTMSIIIIYALDFFKKSLFDENSKYVKLISEAKLINDSINDLETEDIVEDDSEVEVEFYAEEAIKELGVGEALISFLNEVAKEAVQEEKINR